MLCGHFKHLSNVYYYCSTNIKFIVGNSRSPPPLLGIYYCPHSSDYTDISCLPPVSQGGVVVRRVAGIDMTASYQNNCKIQDTLMPYRLQYTMFERSIRLQSLNLTEGHICFFLRLSAHSLYSNIYLVECYLLISKFHLFTLASIRWIRTVL